MYMRQLEKQAWQITTFIINPLFVPTITLHFIIHIFSYFSSRSNFLKKKEKTLYLSLNSA